MNEKLTRSIQTRSGNWTVSVDTDQFPDIDLPVAVQRVKYDKKFNLRIKQEDIHLLDALAETSGMPRSQILNQLLYEILLDDLREISELDVRLLLAETADQRARMDDMHQPWAADALQTSSKAIMDNVRQYNSAVLDFQSQHAPDDHDHHSKHYHDVKTLLEAIGK